MSIETAPTSARRSNIFFSVLIFVVVFLGLICGVGFIGYAMYQRYTGKPIALLSSAKSSSVSDNVNHESLSVPANSSEILKNGPELTGALMSMFAPLAAVNMGHGPSGLSPFGNEEGFTHEIPLEPGQDSFNPPVDAEIPAQEHFGQADEQVPPSEEPSANQMVMNNEQPTDEVVPNNTDTSPAVVTEPRSAEIKVNPITPEEAQSLEREYMRGRDLANRSSFTKARETWMPLAERGYAKAQVALGRMYARGDGVRRDFSEAQRWFKAAARQNDDQGMLYLGKMYLNGDGVPKNREKAIVLFESAAEKGNSDARALIKSLNR